MNPALVAARAGLSRGWIEFKQTLTTPGDLIAILITTGGFLAAMIWTRHTHVPGTHFSLGTTMLVSVGGRGPRAGAGSAAADGAPRVRLERRGPPREGDAAHMSAPQVRAGAERSIVMYQAPPAKFSAARTRKKAAHPWTP